MKKTMLILLAVLLAAALIVSCKPDVPEGGGEEPVDDGLVHVSTFTQFKNGIETAKTKELKTVVLDKDITWDADYNKDAAFTPDLTGLTIDLNGHKIKDIISTAFKPSGNSFTIKNGTLALIDNSTATYQKVIMIGFSEALTGKDYSTPEEQAKAITFEGVTFEGTPYLGDGVFVFTDCTVRGLAQKNNRGLVCYSGYVTLNNSSVISQAHTDGSEVAIYVRETVLKLNNGTTVTSANHGIQAYNNSSLTTEGTVTVQCAGNFAVYTNYASYTRNDGIYHNVVNIGSGTTLKGSVKGVLAMTFGDQYTIAAGATLIGPQGTAEPKYDATSITGAVGTANTNGYIGWSSGKGNSAGAATLTDNRT